MKNSIWKKGLTLALAAMVLTTSVSLPADAAAAAPVAETQETQPGGEAAPAEESTPAAQVEEADPATEAAGQTETITPKTVQAAPAETVKAEEPKMETVEDPVHVLDFRVYVTKAQKDALKDFLKKNGIRFEPVPKQ